MVSQGHDRGSRRRDTAESDGPEYPRHGYMPSADILFCCHPSDPPFFELKIGTLRNVYANFGFYVFFLFELGVCTDGRTGMTHNASC